MPFGQLPNGNPTSDMQSAGFPITRVPLPPIRSRATDRQQRLWCWTWKCRYLSPLTEDHIKHSVDEDLVSTLLLLKIHLERGPRQRLKDCFSFGEMSQTSQSGDVVEYVRQATEDTFYETF